MHATGPDGSAWNVTRRWAPWRPRWRHDDGADGTGFNAFDVDDPAALLVGLLIFLVLLLLMPVVFPVVVGVLEVTLLVILLPAAVLWRLLGRRPWEVEVRPAHGRVFSGRPVHMESGGRWRASRQAIREIVAEIERGERRWETA